MHRSKPESSWVFRLALSSAIALGLGGDHAQALIVEGGATINTTSAGFNSIFYNVGSISDGSTEYLGDGWALTAQHVPVTLGSTYANFQLPGGGGASSLAVNTLTLPGNPDLRLVRLAQSPSLPSIYQNISTTSPSQGSVVAMVGGGDSNGGALYWNAATSNSSGFTIGASSSTPYSGTINPLPSDVYFTTNSVPYGTYQDAGFSGGGGRIQWGESIVTFNNYQQPYNSYNSQVFLTTFYNSVYDPPSSSLWGNQLSTVNAEIAGIGTNMAQVASGDSGGAVFVKTAAGWGLAGTLTYDYQYNNEGGAVLAAYGNFSGMVDLSKYVASIQSIINGTATWTGTSAPGVSSATWDTATSNWTNAANNGTTAFSSIGTGSAVFANANAQYAIPLNLSPNSVGTQSIVVQSGVTATSITFTNTGAANGGADYSFNNAGGNTTGIGGSTGIEISGNGSGFAGTVFLSGANSFTGPVGVNAGVLNLQNALALGSSSGVAVTSGAAMQLQTAAGAIIPTTFGLTASGSTGISLALAGSGVSGAGALVNLTGNNVYAGPISLGASTTIGSYSTTPNDQLSITGGINTGANYSLTFIGPGTTVISGTAFSGSTQYITLTGGGTLELNFAGAGSPTTNLLVATSPLALGGGTFAINGAGGVSSQTVASLSINSGASTIADTSNGAASNLVVTSGTLSRSVGGTLEIIPPTAGNVSFTTAPTLTNGIVGGWATVGLTDWATVSNGQIAALSAGSYTNDTWAAGNNTTVMTSSSPAGGSATNSLRFNTAAANTITLSGTNIITSGGILVTPTVSAFPSTIRGGTLEGAAGADLVVIQNNTAGGLAIASTIANNGSATGLTKSGGGLLSLSAANTYSGTTTLNAGTLAINNSAALGTGQLLINGGTLDNTSGNPITTTNPETWSGSFAFQGSAALSQTTGPITLATTPTITLLSNANALSIGGNVGGSYGLAIAGNGTLALSGSNTFSGGLTINGSTLRVGSTGALNSSAPSVVSFGAASSGTLNLNGNSVSVGGLSSSSATAIVEAAASTPTTLMINGSGIFNFAGTIANGGSGALLLVKSGSGTQVLSGIDSYTGTTTINGGVLEFAADVDLPAGSAPSITVSAGGTVAAGSSIDQPFLSQIASSSTGTIALAANSSISLDFSSATGANLKFASLGSTGNYVYSGTLTPYNSNYSLGGGGGLLTASGSLSGANSLTVQNGGYVALTGSNTYSLGTTIAAGTTLIIPSDAELGAIPTSPSTNITLNGGTFEVSSSFTLNSNRGIALGPGGGTIDVDGITTSNPNTLTYGGAISDSQGSTAGLTLTDTGTLVLGGANTYTGATTVSSGTLRTGAANTLPQNSALVLGLGGTVVLNGFSQNVGSLTGGGIVTDNSAASATLTVGNDGTSPSAFYGVLSDTTASSPPGGALALDKVGSGTLTLTGVSTYSGGTFVSAGTLATVSGGTIGSGLLQITATNGVSPLVNIGATQTVGNLITSSSGGGSARLSVAAGDTLTSTNGLTAAGTLTLGTAGSGTGTVVVSAAPTLVAGTKLQVNAGTLEFNAASGPAIVGAGVTATVAPAATLQLAGSVAAFSGGQVVNITNNGSIASGGGLVVSGTNQSVGTIAGSATTSSGATTYGGDTIVGAGASLTATQILQNSLSIAAGATVTISPAGAGQSQSTADGGTSDSPAIGGASAVPVSQQIDQLQERIIALEQLESAESAASSSILDPSSSAAIGQAAASNNVAVTNPADANSTAAAVAADIASDVSRLLNDENSLLASEGLPPVSSSELASAFSAGGTSTAPAGVPEPSALVLALIGACVAIAAASSRFYSRRKLDPTQ